MDNKRFTKFLFPTEDVSIVNSSLLLAARFIFGLTFLSHGLYKWVAFESLALSFPDPLGVGSTISLLLILFAEVICSIAFIVGFMYRLLMIPMIFAMLMAVFVIHSGDPLATRELAIIYLTIFVIMYITGPGNFSVDAAIYRHSISHKREREILVE
ncbi:MAG: DoxX family protein [Bacteroidaceae bacterium]|nr:DoxX family protein [Bacteroidaceae bacterium]